MTAQEERGDRKLPIPPEIWAEIIAFLEANEYGTISIDVQRGCVVLCRIERTIKPRKAA